MTSKENIEFLQQEGRKFIIGTSKSQLRDFERELLAEDWNTVREGLEVKLCPREGDMYVLCRSADRREKEKAMQERFIVRMEKELEKVRTHALRHYYAETNRLIDWSQAMSKRLGEYLDRVERCETMHELDIVTHKIAYLMLQEVADWHIQLQMTSPELV